MQLEFNWEDRNQQAGAAERNARVPESGPQPETDVPEAEMFAEDTPATQLLRLERELAQRTGKDLWVEVTNNSSTMLRLLPVNNGNHARLRVHHMFLDAPEAVQAALAAWVRNARDPAAGQVIQDYVRENRHLVRPKRPRRIYLRPRGQHYDLDVLYAELNQEQFDGQVDAYITWGKETRPRRGQRSIRLGSYAHKTNLIRIHPALDAAFVPDYVVRYIVFHEMLHAFLGVEETPSGRRRLHPPRFNAMEQAYPDYERAAGWVEAPENMRRLLRRGG